MSALVLLVGTASFGLGRQSIEPEPTTQQEPTVIQRTAAVETQVAAPAAAETTLVASKNSDKYHLPWCSGAARIAEANKIYFTSEAEAKAAGYKPAANCKGL